MKNERKSFGDFDYEDSKAYEKRLLILFLTIKLYKNGELKPEDIPESYEQCKVFVAQDMEFLARKRCPVLKPGEKSGDPLSCRLKQLDDVVATKRDAIALMNKTKPDVVEMIRGQLNGKDIRRNSFQMKLECLGSRSGDVSTFPEMFKQLIEELTGIDEKLTAKLKPVFESFFSEVGPKIELNLKKYYSRETLGVGQCPFCLYPWFENSNELERDFMAEPCFETAEELERFCAVSFRKTFYQKLAEFVKEVPID